ncbi:MAG: SBBP repeat-containing protein [Bacteroidia bacterium]|nr:SBBP repeat-containing protein [Bacteroidia bacterium]
MKKHLLFSFFICCLLSGTAASTDPSPVKGTVSFIENKGQIHDQFYKPRTDVLYAAMAGEMSVHVKNNGVSYQLFRADSYKEYADPKTKQKTSLPGKQTIYRVDLTWLGANPNLTSSEDAALPGYTNYYLQSCPSGILNVKTYKGIRLNNLYKGIDVHYYEKNKELKHDYIVSANADYKQIQIKVEGAELSLHDDGSLIISTPLGKIQEAAPLVYQNNKELRARWRITNNIASFEIDNYDPGMELLIDPVTRTWGTYYGAGPSGPSGTDYGYGIATDGFGSVYMAGYSNGGSAGTAIATLGSHQSTHDLGADAYLVKFDGNGVRQWATYYGGDGNDIGYSCAVDGVGDVYMCGSTGTTNGSGQTTVMVTPPNSHQANYGGSWDAFLVKFNASGVRQWGTYYGGTGDDKAYSVATDSNKDVIIAGETTSGTNIATNGCHQGSYWALGDGFLAKFDKDGTRQWGTYYGGNKADAVLSCATDASGNIFFSGYSETDSGVAIATASSHQPLNYAYLEGAFLVKFNAAGARYWGTYYGDDGSGTACCVDPSGNVYLAGITGNAQFLGNELISTPGSHQPAFGSGSYDAFLAKFTTSGTRIWGTYYGGGQYDYAYSCSTDYLGNVYLSGTTGSSSWQNTMIATPDGVQTTFGGGDDAFLVKFNAIGIRQWGTYYGALGSDIAYSCASDVFGNVFMGGMATTYVGTSIASPGSHQPTYGGGSNDAFLAKFDPCNAPAQPSAIDGPTIACIGSADNTYSVPAISGADSYVWEGPSDWTIIPNVYIMAATPGSSGVFTLTAFNGCGASVPQTISVTVADCTGLMENSLNTEITLYPNPTQGLFNIVSSVEQELTIFNTIGQIVFAKKLNSGNNQIDAGNLAAGVYVLRLKTGTDSKQFRIVKE